MTAINKYISDLLYLHDCVIVPGLGGFVANYHSVEIRETHHLFFPPKKDIGFNRSLSHNDGLLSDFIARKESVSYSDAVDLIKKFVDDAHSRISSGIIIDLGDLGSLRKDAMGNILFIPKEGVSFLPESTGLTSFRFMPIEHKRTAKIEFHDDYAQNPFKSNKTRNWVAAAALAACFLSLSTELKTPSVSQAGINNLFFSSSNNIEQLAAPETELVSDEKDISAHENVIEKPANSRSYHLIGGSFKSTNPANKALNEFITDGFSDASLIDDGNGHIRISLLSFSNKAEAIDYLNEINKQPRFSTVWVLTHKGQ